MEDKYILEDQAIEAIAEKTIVTEIEIGNLGGKMVENTIPNISKNYEVKKSACMYCKKLLSKIVPHLENTHSGESDVKKFSALPKGSHERKKIIDKIRKQGNYQYNINQQNNLIVCRKKINKPNNRELYSVCCQCKGYFVKSALRKHYKHCSGKCDKKRNVLAKSRQLDLEVLDKASDVVRKVLLPVLRPDEISDIIRKDDFLIIWANKMCCKYRSTHLHKMIRAKLRLLASFYLAMNKNYPELKGFASVFDPMYYDATIEAINVTARLDASTGIYAAPSTAFNLGILLKQCTSIYISQCIKESKSKEKLRAEDYLKLVL